MSVRLEISMAASIVLREAFQSKKQRNLGISPNSGGGVVESKKSQVSVGNSSKLGGGLQKSKKSQVQEGIRDCKIITHFHLMRTQKHKICSIIY